MSSVGDTSTMLRVDRLENQIRSLNGQVEQLQFQVKRLEDQLHKFQADVDQRFQESAAHGAVRPTAAVPQKRSDLSESDPDGAAQQAARKPAAKIAPRDTAQPAPPSPNGRRRDAFDPDALPSAAGAPRPLGSPESASRPAARSAEARRDPTAPLDLTPPGLRGQTPASSPVTGGGVASWTPLPWPCPPIRSRPNMRPRRIC